MSEKAVQPADVAFGNFRTAKRTGVRSSAPWPYVELVRPPNLLTAAADILAGYAAAGMENPRALAWLLAASASLYGGGVALNDVFDRGIDALERPERPIPSGRAGVRKAAGLGAALLTFGVLGAWCATPFSGRIASAIAACAVFYDRWGKRHAVVGPINMGACRGLNLLLGISAVPASLAGRWHLALLPFAYIWGVTALSRGEVRGGKRSTVLFSAALLALSLTGLLLVAAVSRSVAGGALVAVLAWRVVPPFWRVYVHPEAVRIRQAVGVGVLSLTLLDASIAAAYAGPLYGFILLALMFVAAWLASRFAVT